MKLALGTVQFGVDYGVANASGRVSHDEGVRILQEAWESGIKFLDTAIAYGESEQALGEIGVDKWQVVTKLPGIPDSCPDVRGWVKEQTHGSLERLGLQRLYAVLLHRPEQLFGDSGPALLKALQDLKTSGQAVKIGVSIYSTDELDQLFRLWRFDLVQAPLNILDRRLVETGWAQRLNQLGVEVHTRSAFLQGLLLMPSDQRPHKFDRWDSIWRTWSHWLEDNGMNPLEACIRYALSIQVVDRVIVGVDSVGQLRQILTAAVGTLGSLPKWPEPIDRVLLNPASWSQI